MALIPIAFEGWSPGWSCWCREPGTRDH